MPDFPSGNRKEAQVVLREALEWQRAEGHESLHLSPIPMVMGEVTRRQGDLEEARRLFAESLELAARRHDEGQIAACLELMANLAATRGEHRAARLAGSAERMREQSGFARSRPELPLPERVEPAWSEGRGMTLDEAVAYALDSLD